jgi:hypothetical protein
MRNIKSLYRALVPRALTWSFCVKSEVKLGGMLLRVLPLVFGQLTASSVKALFIYAKRVRQLHGQMGPKGCAIYLKTCYLLLQHSAGGMVDASPWALGANVATTRRGIPRILPVQHRILVSQGDVGVIRLWLSILGLYRVLEFKGTLKLKTITNPGIDISGFRTQEWLRWVPVFYDKARFITGNKWKMDPSSDLTPWSIPFIRKSSPTSGGRASVMGLPWDLLLFGADDQMKPALTKWLKAVDGIELIWSAKALWKVMERLARRHIDAIPLEGSRIWKEKWTQPGEVPLRANPLWASYSRKSDPVEWMKLFHSRNQEATLRWYKEFHWGKPLWFGRLGFKEEPGKIRVFAMVNIITQTLMAPLHKWIFERLRMIPTDGTFNQVAPVERLIKEFGSEGHWVASYDLSAATDRLPLELQKDLLKPLLGDKLTELWAYFLVGKPYGLPRIAKSYNLGTPAVKYAVGQPMGALSSWALLALTHHALVQLAAHNVYNAPGWFLSYAVLGDDVVIADRLVAREYLRIMKTIGVEISLAKSLVSKDGSLEFAKRTWIRGRDVSPVSLAEMLVALRSLGALAELVNKNMKFGVIRVSSVARFCGFGYRNLGRLPVALGVGNRLSGLIAYLCRPGGIWPMPIEAWLTSVAPGGQEGEVADRSAWSIASSLWGYTLRALLNRMVKFERLLFDLSMVKYVNLEIEVKNPDLKRDDLSTAERAKLPKMVKRPFFSTSVKEFFGMEGSSVLWNEFFIEWVARPFTNTLRKAHERIDDRLRVLDPGILPSWSHLGDIWAEVGDCEDGVNLLPTKVEYAYRLDDEKAPSARLITLWRQLRSKASREVASKGDLRFGFEAAPKARRRRRGG